MDDLLREFLTETAESLDVVDVELVKLEREPNNADILGNIFRLVHTIKGTCGFLGLPRLAALAHAGETLMGKFRDGAPVTPPAVSLILSSIDRLKEILAELEANEREPDGNDADLIQQLEDMAVRAEAGEGGPDAGSDGVEASAAEGDDSASIQVLERDLKPGEVSLDELERAFQEAEGPEGIDALSALEAATAAVRASTEKVAEPAPAEAAAATGGNEGPASSSPASETGERKESTVKNQSIRVNVDALEHLMTMVSELVLTRNQLLEIARRNEESEFKVPLQRLSNVTAELQEGVMKTRMQPIGNAWQKLPRIVRDLSQDLEKKIELEMHGADTELDRQVLELIKDPLTHMVRNSADHGLETGAERLAAGKSETGRITLSAYHEGGHIIISIADDGRGLNIAKIKEKALRSALASEAELEQMSDAQIHKLIFHPGFSTASQVTSVSGRGVGMDVVRTNIELIGGSVELKSSEGQGSTFIIKIPLTLAIVSALIVEAGGHRFAVPQLSVVELVRAQSNSEHRIEMIKDTPVLRLRNKLLPLVHLTKLLQIEAGEGAGEDTGGDVAAGEENSFIVVSQVGSRSFGIVVDRVFHTEEIVVKPMSTMLRDITMFSGNTILGDGSVIMIIDPNGIVQSLGGEVGANIDAGEDESAEHGDSESAVSMLIFRAGSAEPKAVALSLVTRLEEVEVEKIEHSNGRHLVQYRGGLMPLVFIDPAGAPPEKGTQPLLVFTEDGRSMGLAVDEIVDIVEDHLNIEVAADRQGLLGSAIVKGRATEIIDIGHFLPQAFADWFDRGELKRKGQLPRLLLVDDSAFFRNMLTPLLKANGFAVTAVDSAEAALELRERGARFDVIVSDIEMPDLDGFEFAEAVRAEGTWSDVPIIALSSHCVPEAIERGRRAGFHDYVAKFDREGLILSLRQSQIEMGEAA